MPEQDTRSAERVIVDQFVFDITVIVDNHDSATTNRVRDAVRKAIVGIDDVHGRVVAAGEAVQDQIYRLCGVGYSDTFRDALFGQFLRAGNWAWEEVGKHYLDDIAEDI